MMTEMVLVQKAISKVFGDFVSKVVSDGVDVLKSAIRDADLDRKSCNPNLQTRLYQFIVNALNRFTYNEYEKQDKLYDAAESILKGYISTQDNVDAVKSGLRMLASDVNNDTCQEFLETLCGEICSDDNSDLYKEIDMLWKRRESEYIRGEFAKIGQNDREIFEHLNDLKEVLNFIKRNMNRQEGDKAEYNRIPIVNRADEYAEKWDKNVFLNNFNEEDEHAGINIKLREIYVEECLPYYIWKKNSRPSNKLKNLLMKYTNDVNDKKMLLILGQAGIGKSTLITWMMANLVEKKEDILVYQFASDLGNVNWQSDNILDDIFKIIGCSYQELEGKTLILDGFDETHINGDRERILHKLNQELKKKNILKKFSFIITCRENYVNKAGIEGIEYITLQAWNEEQIISFCETYEKENTRDNLEAVNNNIEIKINKILENKEIFGIPLILYMALALNVDVEESSSKVEIYDQIFSLKRGGIYDRRYDVEHRINSPEIKKYIHKISQRIAFWMFENNADEASIPQEKFKKICDTVMIEAEEKNENIQRDVLIGNYFASIKHCEGVKADELQFVHRSIYEYFVTVYFFESIHKLTSKEEVAGKLGELLKDGELSEQILEFIKYKFDSMKELNLPDITKEVFNIMLKDGMTYYTKERYRDVIWRDINVFNNMVEVVCLWNTELGEFNRNFLFYLQNSYNRKCISYLRGADLRGANLIGADLRGADLRGADLKVALLTGANLSGANLNGANLRAARLNGAYLEGAHLEGTNLIGAHLEGTNLIGVDLIGADLKRADLRRTDLIEAHLEGANLIGARLRGANLTGANLVGAKLIGEKSFEENSDEVSFLSGDILEEFLYEDLNGRDSIEEKLLLVTLIGARLKKTIFDDEQVDRLCGIFDLSDSYVYISGIEEPITYKEYCIKKQEEQSL